MDIASGHRELLISRPLGSGREIRGSSGELDRRDESRSAAARAIPTRENARRLSGWWRRRRGWTSTSPLSISSARCGAPYQLTTRQITARSLVTAGAISQRLARAETAGLITRAPTTTSRRGVLVTLTPQGHTLIAESAIAELYDSGGLAPGQAEHRSSASLPTPSSRRCARRGVYEVQ